MTGISPKIRAEFVIRGDGFDPQLISSELGMTPARCGVKGDQLQCSSAPRQCSIWLIATDYEDSYDVETQLSSILARIGPKKEVLQRLKAAHQLDYTLSIVAKMSPEQMPGVHFDGNCIRFANDIGAEIDIDLYCSILQTTTSAGHEAVDRSSGA